MSAGVSIGDVFSFCSSLYFRGKLTYAEQFGRPSQGIEKAYVITSSNGLVPSHLRITATTMDRFAGIPIDVSEERYRSPLMQSANELLQRLEPSTQVILLGSVATGKYVEPLIECFGERLLFPYDFIGRGDMSRGGLLLRAAAARRELEYQQLSAVSLRTGKRPPKLGPR
jgi:hypothetical protein